MDEGYFINNDFRFLGFGYLYNRHFSLSFMYINLFNHYNSPQGRY